MGLIGMTFDKLQRILISENVNPNIYRICDMSKTTGDTCFLVELTDHGRELYSKTRGGFDLMAYAPSEHAACIVIMKDLIDYCAPQLAKYIQ